LVSLSAKNKNHASDKNVLGCFLYKLQPNIFLLFISGDTLGSFLYVPCEVMEQEMEVQGSSKTSTLNATLKGNISQSSGTGDVWLL
jgi:hypothetical protein